MLKKMPSKTTQALAARVPNSCANQIHRLADTYGVTTSDVVSILIDRALPTDHKTRGQGSTTAMSVGDALRVTLLSPANLGSHDA
jgi:antitoxin component of RelBE/YafQ-DinJ toxin-antitoxin module